MELMFNWEKIGSKQIIKFIFLSDGNKASTQDEQ